MKKLFLSLPLALGLGIPSFAQDLALRVHVVAATVQDSPVRVVQLILWPNPPDSRSSITIGVVVHNFSDKRVVSTRVEYWVGAPSGCAAQATSLGGGSVGPESVYLEPGSEGRLWTSPSPQLAVSASLWMRSAYMQVQIGVGAADFSDGTSWRRSNNKPFDSGQIDVDASSCRDWAWPANLTPTRLSRWNDPETNVRRGIGQLHLYRLPPRTTATPSPDSPEWATRENIPTDSYYYDCTVQLDINQGRCGRPRLSPPPRSHLGGDSLDF